MNRKTTLIAAMAIGILICVLGVYLSFFETRGFVRTTAIIDRIDQTWSGTDADGVDEYDYDVWVTYSAEGKTYSGELDTYSSGYEVGKRIRIYYDPANPEKIHGDSRKLGFILAVAGPVVAVAAAATFIHDRKKESAAS